MWVRAFAVLFELRGRIIMKFKDVSLRADLNEKYK